MNIWKTSSGRLRQPGMRGHGRGRHFGGRSHGRSHGHSHGHSYGSSHSSHRAHRPYIRSSRGTPYLQIVVILVALGLVGRLAWQGVKYLRQAPAREAARAAALSGSSSTLASGPNGPDPWLHDSLASLDQAAQSSASGNLSQAETDVDRAGSILVTMRLSSHAAPVDFFGKAVATLDRVAGAHPENKLLIAHVTQTRMELAELGSSMASAASPGADPYIYYGDSAPGAGGSRSGEVYPQRVPAPDGERHVSLNGPRHIAAGQTLNVASVGGNYLDATPMAETAEMLMPPVTRSFSDGVSVENLTLAGAAQTLDGIHWRNVTFVGTRLRYEGGPLDLENVRFVRCRFGFVADERGARLANLIALGQTSLTIE